MKMLLTLLVAIIVSGCSHVSVTETRFTGQTRGLNPYGKGDVIVTRVTFWGTSKALVKKLMNEYRETQGEK